jgi:hypothetical protein
MRCFTNNRGIVILFCALLIFCTITLVEAKTNEEIYQDKLAQFKPDDVNGHYQLGLWCLQNKLPEQSKSQFEKVLELDPNHTGAHENLGHVKHKGKWLTHDEMMKAQGYVKFEEQWITPKERDIILKLNKLYPWKGVIDTPSADSENLPWEKARDKETQHFIVSTNLSADTLNDICFILEYSLLKLEDFLDFSLPNEKLKVLVSRDKTDLQKTWEDITDTKAPAEITGTFIIKNYPANKKPRKHHLLLACPTTKTPLTKTLTHEITHYAIRLAIQTYKILYETPSWFNEGLATYFGTSIFKDKKMVTGLIDEAKLANAKILISNNSYIKLKDFINYQKAEFDKNYAPCYPESWSVVYFLMHGNDGKYNQGFKDYLGAWKKNKINIQNKDAHIKLFEQCIGVTIDELEKEWKEYIMSLPEK